MKIKITANSPIAHGSFTEGIDTGNISEFRKIPVCHNGIICEIPAISGNAIRGTIRRLLTREFFIKNNLEEQIDTKTHDKLYAILANGGALGKDLSPTVDPAYIKEIRKQLPILSLLGSACYKYMISGMCTIGFAILDCQEIGTGEFYCDNLLTEIGETRHVDKTIINVEKTDLKPMPYVTEAVIKGATFSGEINFAPQATEIEKSALFHGIKLINHLGGKTARGYGKVSIYSDAELNDAEYISFLKDTDIEFINEFIKGI